MAWAALLRLALFPTIVWDFLVGMRLAGVWRFDQDLLALAALLCFYHGGMVLNDWRDRGLDREVGRRRPLADGRLSPALALLVAIGLLTAGWFLAKTASPSLEQAAPWLLGMIVIYDLSAGSMRLMLGPWLLAGARALSLAWPTIALAGITQAFTVQSFPPFACYAIYFLSISRVAQYEEHGLLGMRGLAYYLAASLSPLVLAYGTGVQLWFLVPWALFMLWLLPPAWRLRHEVLSPKQVQQLVRHGLSSAPLVLGVCLIAVAESPQDVLLALAAPAVMLLVRTLARSLPPE